MVIYLKEDVINGEYEKTALMFAKGYFSYTDEEDMFKKVREEVAKSGANGILLKNIEDPETGAKVVKAFL